MFIVHVIPYTRGKVACPYDFSQMEVYRVKDDMLLSFLDSIISKKVYVSIRVAFPDDENVSCWKMIE